MKTNDEAGIGRGEETYRKVIYYRTLVKKITTIPKKKERGEFLECHSNKSVLVGFINYAFQTWEIHLIKSFETSFDWSLRRKKKAARTAKSEWWRVFISTNVVLHEKIIFLVYAMPENEE